MTGALGGAALLLGCEAVVGIHDRSVAVDASVAGSPDAAGPADAAFANDEADVATCTHARPPAMPSSDDGTMDLDLTFALNALDLGVRLDGGASPLVGYDVDGVCTCPGPPSCAAVDPDDTHCDDPGGRDTAINLVFRAFAELTGGTFDPTTYSAQVLAGANGLLVRVQHYSGGADDTQVMVSVYLSPGTVAIDGGGGHPVPTWDGTDLWALDMESVVTGVGGAMALPVHFDLAAYVANHVLVARTDFPIELYAGPEGGTAVLDGIDTVLTATLNADDAGAYSLREGMIAGRVPMARVPRGMSGVTTVDASFICPGSNEYAALKVDVCRAADLLASGAVDANAPCDALGFGVAFAGRPAVLGPVAVRPSTGSPCTDAGPESCN
jgi:hypothetical protein